MVVGGIPGAGKTTLATGIADRLGWLLLRSDEVRRELAADPVDRYAAQTTRATYDELLCRARAALSMGMSVVLDATWSDAALRAAAQTVALETASDLVELECVVPVEVAATRAQHRRAAGADASEADAEVVRSIASRAEPWPSAQRISTAGGPADSFTAAMQHLRRYLPAGHRPRPRMLPD